MTVRLGPLIYVSNTVADLIASNLSYLPPAATRMLRILLCFGMQRDINLLEIFEGLRSRIISALGPFVEQGILNIDVPLVISAHNIIKEEVYDIISVDKRQAIPLKMGKFLGDKLELSFKVSKLSYEGMRSMTSCLISLTCNQVNSMQPGRISNNSLRWRLDRWNRPSSQSLF